MTTLICISTMSYGALLVAAHILEGVLKNDRFNLYNYNYCMKAARLDFDRKSVSDLIIILNFIVFNALELVLCLDTIHAD
jgi:hypothetical protein